MRAQEEALEEVVRPLTVINPFKEGHRGLVTSVCTRRTMTDEVQGQLKNVKHNKNSIGEGKKKKNKENKEK